VADRPRFVLGIDPGTFAMGYCLIEVPKRMSFKAVRFGTLYPEARSPLHRRLGLLMEQLLPIFEEAKGHWAECVVEQPFVDENHLATLAIAGARALALAYIGQIGLRFHQYPPQVWKKITGRGNATPQQYSYVVGQLLGLRERMPPDAAAAGGLAIYHATLE